MSAVSKCCSRCQVERGLEAFYRFAQGRFGVHPSCKTCMNAAHRKWVALNLEKRRKIARDSARKHRPKRKDAILLWARTHRPRLRELERARYTKDPAKAIATVRQRTALKLKATPQWADKNEILAFYAKAQQLTARTGTIHHVDHVVPLRSALVCGLHWEGNLQVLTQADNAHKSNSRWPDMP